MFLDNPHEKFHPYWCSMSSIITPLCLYMYDMVIIQQKKLRGIIHLIPNQQVLNKLLVHNI